MVGRKNIPMIALIATNDEWGAEKKNQDNFFDNHPDKKLKAKGLGIFMMCANFIV